MGTNTTFAVDGIGSELSVGALTTLNTESETTYWGILVDDTTDGLAVNLFDGLGINTSYSATNDPGYFIYNADVILADTEELSADDDSLATDLGNTIATLRFRVSLVDSGNFAITGNSTFLNRRIPVGTASYNINGSQSYNTRSTFVTPGSFFTNIDEDLLGVSNSDILNLGGNFNLQTGLFATYDATIDRYVNNRTGNYQVNLGYIANFYNQATYVVPDVYDVTGFDVVATKNNTLAARPGDYQVTSFVINTSVINPIWTGRYVKDTANFYTLFVDEATDYTIFINTTELGILDNTNLVFTGAFARHPTSAQKLPINITKVTSEQIKLNITHVTTTDLYGKYVFDILVTQGTSVHRVIQGNIVINEMVTN